MLYVLDTNVLITARDTYYGFGQVPEFWTWLIHLAKQRRIGVPREALEEILEGQPHHGKDPLYAWAHDKVHRAVLDLGEADFHLVQRVVNQGYAPDLTEDQVAGLRADPFVIAHALADPAQRCVVSNETPRPSRAPHNRKVPDACAKLGIQCVMAPRFIRDMQFSTMWEMLA